MIYRTPEPRLEPNHHLEEYLMCDGADFIQPDNNCIFDYDDVKPCNRCGQCEDKFFACSEDEYENARINSSLVPKTNTKWRNELYGYPTFKSNQ